jgi:hypothetical protein
MGTSPSDEEQAAEHDEGGDFGDFGSGETALPGVAGEPDVYVGGDFGVGWDDGVGSTTTAMAGPVREAGRGGGTADCLAGRIRFQRLRRHRKTPNRTNGVMVITGKDQISTIPHKTQVLKSTSFRRGPSGIKFMCDR